MTFQPLVPAGGLSGWRFLTQTMDRQSETFEKSTAVQRDVDYFLSKIDTVKNPEDLVSDRRLLDVSLTAFGLQDDLDNRAFIQKILEDGTESSTALANRLSDDRYTKLAEAFGFGNVSGSNTGISSFGKGIAEKYLAVKFEIAVGNQDQNMRLALNAMRELPEIAAQDTSENTKWFTVLGTPPIRTVFERALGLPASFGQIDIEKQVDTLKELASSRLGLDSLSDLEDDTVREKLVERFLLQTQVAELATTTSSLNTALTLLSSMPRNRF